MMSLAVVAVIETSLCTVRNELAFIHVYFLRAGYQQIRVKAPGAVVCLLWARFIELEPAGGLAPRSHPGSGMQGLRAASSMDGLLASMCVETSGTEPRVPLGMQPHDPATHLARN